MVSFSKLPCEIKENIFSRIRIRDLYEVSVVSEEWWWLTVRTYQGMLSEEDLLIKTLLTFYNRVKEPLTPLMWSELVKYAKSIRVQLNYMAHPMVLDNFLASRKPIRSLGLRTVSYQANLDEAKLESILKYFPHLKQLKLHNFALGSSFSQIPKGIKQVQLSRIRVNGAKAWSSLFEDTDSVQSLVLQVYGGLTYDYCLFRNLKRLSLQFKTPLPDDQMKNILDSIRGHTFLRSVKLSGVEITKEWFNLFGKTIESISLRDIHIANQFLSELGTDGCYARRVMSFVCNDLTTIKRFTLADMSLSLTQDEMEEDTDIGQHCTYTCKPRLMEEHLSLEFVSSSRQLQTFTTTDAGPALQNLHIICADVKADQLTKGVPASVKKLYLGVVGEFENLSIGQLCEEPQNMEELNFHSFNVITCLSIQRDCFTSCAQLRILKMTHLNREGFHNLLHHCVCLEKLSLRKPERGSFTNRPTCVSKTIREVNLEECDATLEDILYHFPNLEVLRLSSHLIRPTSMPTSVAKLKHFSATFHGFKDFRGDSMNLALVMDTVNVPCKLFYSDLDKSSYKFTLGWSDSIIDDFCETKGFVYFAGIPMRYLEARGMKILPDIKQFNEKCYSRN